MAGTEWYAIEYQGKPGRWYFSGNGGIEEVTWCVDRWWGPNVALFQKNQIDEAIASRGLDPELCCPRTMEEFKSGVR
jgi:hypothetical protein